MVSTMHGDVAICKLGDLPSRGKKTITVEDISVLVIACDAGLFAIEDACPQTGRPMAHGAVLDATITSPHTGARYDLTTGRYVGGGQSPLQSHWLRVFPLHVVEDEIFITLPR